MNSYRKLCTEFYELDKPNPPEDAFTFYRNKIQEAGGPALEPMCGSGRFLVPLLKTGFIVDGSDASIDMLNACRKRAAKEGVKPRLSKQFLHELSFPRKYSLIFIPSGSFSLITDSSQVKESLRKIHDHLLPGGKLILEIEQFKEQPPSAWPWGGRWVERPDGAKIIIGWMGHFDPERRISHSINRYELTKNGKLLQTEFEDFILRYYKADEFTGLLIDANFSGIKYYHPYDCSSSKETDDTLVFECIKK